MPLYGLIVEINTMGLWIQLWAGQVVQDNESC